MEKDRPRRLRTLKIQIAVLLSVFLIGLGVYVYPYVSDWFNSRYALLLIEDYERDITALSGERTREEMRKAKEYNDSLRGDPVTDPFIPGSGRALPQNYLDVLRFENEVMCYVDIPKINVMLPVYHGTSEEVLQKGVGHIEGTAFPIGGEGNHPVLTGHTGLPRAMMFTDLTKMEEGDRFFIHILGNILIYEIDDIQVIDPEDISNLASYYDQDYVTLLTCTPYGINSHRLLVRGSRIYRLSVDVNFGQENTVFVIWMLGLLTVLVFLGIIGRVSNSRKKIAGTIELLCAEIMRPVKKHTGPDIYGTEEHSRKLAKKRRLLRRRIFTSLMLLGAVGIVIVTWLFYFRGVAEIRRYSDPAPYSEILGEDGVKDWLETKRKLNHGYMQLNQILTVSTGTGKIDLRLINPPYSDYAVIVTLAMKNNPDEILYRSEKLYPGTAVGEIDPEIEIPDGESEAVAKYIFYDADDREIGSDQVDVMIIKGMTGNALPGVGEGTTGAC